MAKEDTSTFEITVIHVKTSSSNETLRQNVKEIANTISRSLAPQSRQQALPPAQPFTQVPKQMPLWDNPQGTETNSDEFIDVEPESESPKPKTRSVRRVPTPEILNDIEFTSGSVPFETFYESKGKPEADVKRYLLIVAWLKEHRGISEVTVNHIYTCFKFMKWNVPKDPGQPLRNMKHQGWLSKGSDKGAYVLHHIGENTVNKMANE
jgi:hypothetical protein